MSGQDHHHGHEHGQRSPRRTRRLTIALIITAVYMLAEAIGGFLSNSLALLADAGHMLTDVAGLSLTLFSFWFASRPATAKKTYGYYRTEILAAFVNGVVLVLLSVWVIVEAFQRWSDPPQVAAGQMMAIAVGGLIVNMIAAKLLHADHKHDLNMHGAWLHVMGDMLGSIAAIIAGAAIMFWGALWADPLCSVLISLIIIAGAWRLVSDSVNVLLEGTPKHININDVENEILRTPGVAAIHDLHVWTISSGIEAMSVHINHDDEIDHADLLSTVRERLHSRFGIDHMTVQMETIARQSEELYVCGTGANCFVAKPASTKVTVL